MTYAAAQKLGRVQWDIVCELADKMTSSELVDVANNLDLELAAKLLDERLEPLKKQLCVDLTTVAH